MDKSIIVTVVSILIVLVATGMVAMMVSGSRTKKKQHMMSVIRGVQEDHGHGAGKVVSKNARRDELSRKLKQRGEPEEEEDGEKKKNLATLLMQAGLTITPKQYWLYSALFAIVMTGLVFLMGKGPFLTVTTAIICFMGIPKFIVKRKIANRQKKFLGDLADALEAMMRLLKAGMPVSEAIKMVAREFNGPMGEEMGRIFDQQKIGVSLPDAVLDAARRMPLPEMQMFATAVSIQAQTGSSLSEILENLARVIRLRFRLKRKVQALSSEAKASAMIIGALPIFVATGMYFINPEYIGLMFTHPTGKMMTAGACFWMFCGIVVMKQMINFKV